MNKNAGSSKIRRNLPLLRLQICTTPFCHGQALTEFLALAIALVPLYLLVPLISKYLDMAHSVQLASRYISFQAMTHNDALNSWKTEDQLAGEVRRRFFSNSDSPIKTNDVIGNFMAHENLYWRMPNNKHFIANSDTDVSVSFGPNQRPAHASAFSSADDGVPFNSIAGLNILKVADRLGLQSRGIYSGNVSIKLANLPAGLKSYAPLATLSLTITRHTSLVIDGWQAKDPNMVQSRIDAPLLVPALILRTLDPAFGVAVPLFEIGKVSHPKLGRLDFWNDVIPSDRLK